jgi:hypothetical protein
MFEKEVESILLDEAHAYVLEQFGNYIRNEVNHKGLQPTLADDRQGIRSSVTKSIPV